MNAKVNPTNPWSMPAATLVLPADAPREQWLEARRTGLGSSDAALLMGVAHEKATEYELWLDKTGRADHGEQTEQMRRGRWLEPHVVDYFRDATSLDVRRVGLVRHKEHEILLATPDRLVGDGGLLEVKTIGAWAKVAAEWRHSGVARHAYVQGQWQLLVTGRTHLWLAAYTVDQEPQIRGPIERDEPLIDRMNRRAHIWWETHVVGDEAPPVDLATITDEEIALRWPKEEPGTVVETEYPSYLRQMLTERAECKAAEKAAEERAKEIDQALKVMAGSAEALCIGERPVVTFKSQRNNPTVNPALEIEMPEVWEKFVKQTSSRRIHVRKGWDEAA